MNNIAKGKNIIKTYKIDNTKGHEEIRKGLQWTPFLIK